MMITPRDLYTWSEQFPLPPAVQGGPQGTLYVDYEVRPYTDVRNLRVARAYMITCKQRVVMPTAIDNTFGPSESTSFTYPAMLVQKMFFKNTDGNNASWYLVDYSPKTLNSAINANITSGTGSNTQTTSQYTTGSSLSETNSYEVSVNSGFNMEGLTGGASVSSGHSETRTTEQSHSTGSSKGADKSLSSSDSMSIKDWSAYSNLDFTDNSIQWIWGQEYPWDVLQFRFGTPTAITLPLAIQARMWLPPGSLDASQVFPPSKLSLFGPNLVAKATWLYTVADEPVNPVDEIQFTHQIIGYQGSHGQDSTGKLLTASLVQQFDTYFNDQSPTKTATLDLGQLALDPIDVTAADNGAIVGFVRSQFICEPNNNNGFAVKSTSNNLYVLGTGFSTPASSDAPMTADLQHGSATMKIFFKIADADASVSLYIKHWKLKDTGCSMSVQINPPAATLGEDPHTIDTFKRYIDWAEAGSGTDNVTEIILRKKDYQSADYYDYLNMGRNMIQLTFTSMDTSTSPSDCLYAIRALAIA